MWPNRIQLTLRLPRSSEIRYAAHVPAVGDLVHSRSGTVWVVVDVRERAHRAYEVICAPLPEPRRGLVADLLARLRPSSPSRAGERGRERR